MSELTMQQKNQNAINFFIKTEGKYEVFIYNQTVYFPNLPNKRVVAIKRQYEKNNPSLFITTQKVYKIPYLYCVKEEGTYQNPKSVVGINNLFKKEGIYAGTWDGKRFYVEKVIENNEWEYGSPEYQIQSLIENTPF